MKTEINGRCGLAEKISKNLIFIITAALIAAVWIGVKIPCRTDMGLSLENPMKDNLYMGAAAIFLPEILSATVITLSAGRGRGASIVTAAVFVLRGLAAGCAIRFCASNSADAEIVAELTAFCVQTVVFGAYAVILTNAEKENEHTFRLLCYLAVSGGACILRSVPYLLLP